MMLRFDSVHGGLAVALEDIVAIQRGEFVQDRHQDQHGTYRQWYRATLRMRAGDEIPILDSYNDVVERVGLCRSGAALAATHGRRRYVFREPLAIRVERAQGYVHADADAVRSAAQALVYGARGVNMLDCGCAYEVSTELMDALSKALGDKS